MVLKWVPVTLLNVSGVTPAVRICKPKAVHRPLEIMVTADPVSGIGVTLAGQFVPPSATHGNPGWEETARLSSMVCKVAGSDLVEVEGETSEMRANLGGGGRDMEATRPSTLTIRGWSAVMSASRPSVDTAPVTPEVAPEGPPSEAESSISS